MTKGYVETAVAFSSALSRGEWERAHTFLAPALQNELTPARLRHEYLRLFPDSPKGSPTIVQFNEQFAMDDWPDKQPGDVGWAYVSLCGEHVIEAVTVIVTNAGGALRIRSVEWGRP